MAKSAGQCSSQGMPSTPCSVLFTRTAVLTPFLQLCRPDCGATFASSLCCTHEFGHIFLENTAQCLSPAVLLWPWAGPSRPLHSTPFPTAAA